VVSPKQSNAGILRDSPFDFSCVDRRCGEVDLSLPPVAWEQVEKFELDDAFGVMAKETFGFEDKSPSLKNLPSPPLRDGLRHYF